MYFGSIGVGAEAWPLSMMSFSLLACRGRGVEFGIRIPDRREVGGARLGVQLVEQDVAARARLLLRDRGVGLVEVAEHDGLGRTHLLAGGLDLAVADVAALVLRIDPGLVHALHAV